MSVLEQLRARQSEAVTSVGVQSIHVKASILFDKKDAAKIDLDSVYQLALGGLEVLKKQEPRLKPFEATLFSPATKEFSRELQQKETNDRLDESINTVLSLLAPFFLEKHAQKVLEYLIRRYSIHQFNKTAIFKAVLPYHQTMKFMKMITLTKLKGSLWEFLEPVLGSGAPLSRNDLVARIVADRNLLTFILDMVKEAVASRKSYRVLFGFYMTTLLEVINKHGLSEYMLRDLWPYIITGLASSDENYQASTIMILSTACWKVTIAPQLVRGAIDTLIAHTPPHLHSNAIRALIMIVQNSVLSSQVAPGNNKNANNNGAAPSATPVTDFAKSNAFVATIISEDTLSVLSSWTDAAQVLSGFMQTQSYDTTTLMSFLLTKLAEDIGRDATRAAFLSKLFSAIDVPQLVPDLTVTLLRTYSGSSASSSLDSTKPGLSVKKTKKSADYEDSNDEDDDSDDEHEESNVGERLAQLMTAIDIKYPTQLDQGIASMLHAHPTETRWQDLFDKGRHHGVQVQNESGAAVSTTLTLCLRETLPTTQIFALSKLLELTTSHVADSHTRDLLQKTLLEHLRSNQSQLVLNALAVPHLGEYVEAEELFNALENLTFFSTGEAATKAFSIAISLFLNPANSENTAKTSTPAGKKKSKAKESEVSAVETSTVLSIANSASKLMPMILYAIFCPDDSMRLLAGPAALRFHKHFLGRTPAQPCQTVFSHYSSSLANESTSASHSILALAEGAVANDDYFGADSSWHSIGANPRARTVFLLVLGCALSQVASRKIQPHPSRTVEQECLNLATVLLSHFSSDLHTMLLSVDTAADVASYAVASVEASGSESRVVGVPDWQPQQLQGLLGSTPYFRRESFYRYTVWALLNLTSSLSLIATPGASSDHLVSVAQQTFKLLASAQVPSLFAPHFKTLLGFIGSDIHVAKFLEHMWLTPQAASCNASTTVVLSSATVSASDFSVGQHGSSTSALVCMRALAFLHSLLNSRVQQFATRADSRETYHDFATQLAASLLVPLAHSDSGVRVAAISCLSAAGQLIQATGSDASATATPKKSGKKTASATSGSAFSRLISELASKRSEFALSESTLAFALERFFFQDSTRAEDTHTTISRADREVVHTQLLTSAMTMPTTFAKYVLLHVLLATPCGAKLNITAPLFKIVTKALLSEEHSATAHGSADSDIFTFYLLDTLVRQWQTDCAAALNESENHFALLLTSLSTPLDATITLDPTIISNINPSLTEKVIANSSESRSKSIQSEYRFSLQGTCLAQISPEFFAGLSDKHQSQLFEHLCELVLSPSLPVKEAVQSVLRSIPVDPATIAHELQACVEKTAPIPALDTAPPAKRSKSGLSSTPSSLHPAAEPVEKTWIARVTVLLEMLQYKPEALRMGAHYVQALFSLLRNTAETDNALAQDSSAEYIEQLIFTTLISITEGIANGRAAMASANGASPSISRRSSEKMQVDGDDEHNDDGAHELAEHIEDEAIKILLDKSEFAALQSKYDVDCIIQIIRIRSNPTLQNNALLLLSHIARIYPAKVMANVMSIFSFMGASTERSDDTYTFNVIEKTVERVIPALLSHAPGVEGRVSASALVAVFVDRIDSIPQHRRLMLFYHLLTKILRRGYLPLALALLLHRQSSNAALDRAGLISPAPASSAPAAAAEPVSMSAFALALFQKLTPYECVSAVVYTLYWLYGFEAKLERSPLATGRTKDLTATDKANMRPDVIQFALSYVTSRVFITQLLELPSEEQTRMQNAYLALFQALLVFAKFVSSSSPQGSANSLLDSIYKLTDRVNELMSIYTFFDAMGALFKQNDATIKHRALILFNERIKAVAKAERAGFDFGEQTTMDFIQFTMNLFKTVFNSAADESLASSDPSGSNDEGFTLALNKQTAALSVEIVARLFGYKEEHQSTFVQMADLVIGALTPYVDRYTKYQTEMAEYHAQLARQSQENAASKKGRRNSGINLPAPPAADPSSETAIKIQASLIVALATLISNARERLLPLVNKFFPLILGTLRCAITLDASKDPRQLLRQSCLAALHVCIGVMSRFLSQYWPQVLQLLLQPTDVFHGTPHWDGVVAILQLIGEVVPARLLIDPLEATFTHILEYPVESSDIESFDKRRAACVQLMAKMTGQIAAGLDRTAVQSHHQQVFRVFLRMFEYSELTIASPTSSPTYASLIGVEEAIIRAFMQLTFKLNETLFKPLFLVLLDWAKIQSSVTAGLSGNASETPAIYSPRTHFFYRLVASLAEELKGIFVPYFSYIIDHAVRVVLQPAHAIKKGDPLLKSANAFSLSPSGALGGFLVHQHVSLVLNGLHKLFLYDRDGFMDKARFDRVMNPIVDQLDCCYIEHYKSRVTHSIVPCIAQLAVCVGNDALWKPLNHNVLAKARHSDAQVRFSVLLAIGEFYHRMGEAFLPLLHESAQTFAELLEDSNPEVERQCLALIKQIEAVLGEDGGVMALLSK